MIKIASIQTNIIWENPKANKLEYDKLFQSLEPVDLIILPEMFTTGFSMKTENIAENNSGNTLFWLQEHSKTLDTCICLLYTSPSPRDLSTSRMPSSA